MVTVEVHPAGLVVVTWVGSRPVAGLYAVLVVWLSASVLLVSRPYWSKAACPVVVQPPLKEAAASVVVASPTATVPGGWLSYRVWVCETAVAAVSDVVVQLCPAGTVEVMVVIG